MNFILKLALFYVCLFAFCTAYGETKYLLVDGGASQSSNYIRYYNSVLRGYEILKSKQLPVSVAAKDGTWRVESTDGISNFNLTNRQAAKIDNANAISYPPIGFSAKGGTDLEKAIIAAAKNGDTVYLHFTGHGGPPEKEGVPNSATISLFGSDLSFATLENIVQKYPQIKFKIFAGTCYGGGVHTISRNLPNVCSSAASPYFTPNNSGSREINIFEHGLWKSFEGDKKISLGSLSVAAFEKDVANVQLGSLSSFDYIDFVLKRGQYGRKYGEIQPKQTRGSELPLFPHAPAYWDSVNVRELPADYRSIFPVKMLDDHKLEGGLCTDCCSNPVQHDLARIERLAKTLSELARQAVVQDLEKKADRQPAQVRTVFHDVIDDMKKNGANYLLISIEYDRKFQDLKRRWIEAKQKPGNDWRKEGGSRAQLQKEFDELKAAAERNLKQYSFNHQMLERLDRLEEFNKTGTVEQKRKFTQLLQCEWEPL